MSKLNINTLESSLYSIKELKSILICELERKLIILKKMGNHYDVSHDFLSIVKQINFNDPVVSCITQSMSVFPYFGSYTAFIITHILIQIIQQFNTSDSELISKFVKTLNVAKSEMISLIKPESVKMEYLSLKHMHEHLFKYLRCKLEFDMPRESIIILSETICQCLIYSIDLESGKSGHIFIKNVKGRDNFKCYRGVLLTSIDSDVEHVHRSLVNTVPIDHLRLILVVEVVESDIYHNLLFDIIKDNHINIVACQKQICSEVKLYCRRNNIILFERIGQENLQALSKLANVEIINDLNHFRRNQMVGVITGIMPIQLHNENFVLFENKSVSIASLLVSEFTLIDKVQFKLILQQSIMYMSAWLSHDYRLIERQKSLSAFCDNIKKIQHCDPNIHLTLQIFWKSFSALDELVEKRCLDPSSCTDLSEGCIFSEEVITLIVDSIVNILNIGVIIFKK